MKNALNYFYNLNSFDIHQVDGIYKFNINDNLYCFLEYTRDIREIKEIYNLSLELLHKGVYCHQIIPNKNGEFITYVNQKPYVLLQVYIDMDKKISLEDIEFFSNSTSLFEYNEILKRNNWNVLWESKIDYFEYQMSQLGKKYHLIRDSFNYYIGLVENGISLFNSIKIDYKYYSVQHRRIKYNDTLFDLYNPLNFVIDLKIRDISEYFKEQFIYYDNVFNDIKEYLIRNNLSTYECLMFFIRMLYPSFYFDLYEEIIEERKQEKNLLNIIDKTNNYQLLLKNIYLFLNNYIPVPEIEWLKKHK